jgi:hypothetical protein
MWWIWIEGIRIDTQAHSVRTGITLEGSVCSTAYKCLKYAKGENS